MVRLWDWLTVRALPAVFESPWVPQAGKAGTQMFVDSVDNVKELLACPASGSVICRACQIVNPGVIGIALVLLAIAARFWPCRPWPLFIRGFQVSAEEKKRQEKERRKE